MNKNTLGANIPTVLLNRLHLIGWYPNNMKAYEIELVLNRYLEGAGKKFEIFSEHNNVSAKYIAEHNDVSFTTALRILLTVSEMVKDGELSPAWLIPNAETAFESGVEKIVETTKNVVSEATGGTNKMLNSIKWIGFTALAGVGLYYAWPYLRKMRKGAK